LTRTTLAVICIVGLIAMSVWVLRPFLAATVWATMIVVATWPLLKSLEARFANRRAPAVAVMTLGMLLLLVVPLWLAIDIISEHSEQLTAAGRSFAENGLPLPPDWVATLPLVGEKLSTAWTQLAVSGASGILAKVLPHAADTGKWVLGQVGGLGGMLIQFLLVVIVAAILYSSGETAARMMRRFGRRLAGERGENSIILAGQAIRGVALGRWCYRHCSDRAWRHRSGRCRRAFCLLAIGSHADVLHCPDRPDAGTLLPAVGWMYWTGDTGWATALLVWSLVVGMLDNVCARC
jgi:predicted PurR-regulated permease PerM